METLKDDAIYGSQLQICEASEQLIDDLSVSTDKQTIDEYMYSDFPDKPGAGTKIIRPVLTDDIVGNTSGITGQSTGDSTGKEPREIIGSKPVIPVKLDAASNNIWSSQLTGELPVKYLLNPIDASDFLSQKLPPRKKIMSPWLPESGLALLYAERGVGKTFFSLEIAVAIATGKSFLNWKVESPYKVLYLDGEMCQVDLQGRLKKITENYPALKNGDFSLITPERHPRGCPDLSDKEWLTELEIVSKSFEVIVVDNISTLCRGGNENEAESWSVVQEWAINQRAGGKSVLFIHHAGKSGKQRGTSKREDVMDTVIKLARPEDYRTCEGARFEVHFEKSRGFSGKEAEPFEVQLLSDKGIHDWRYSKLEETDYEKAVHLINSGMTQTDVADEIGVHKSTISRYWNRAKEEGLCQTD